MGKGSQLRSVGIIEERSRQQAFVVQFAEAVAASAARRLTTRVPARRSPPSYGQCVAHSMFPALAGNLAHTAHRQRSVLFLSAQIMRRLKPAMTSNLKIAAGLLVAFAALIAVSWWLNLVRADWFTAIATLLLAIAAFFTIIRDEVRRWIRRPSFGIVFAPQSPDCNQISTEFRTRQIVEDLQGQRILEQQDRADVHYVRARVKNVGNLGAEDVEVSVLEVRRRGDADNTLRPIPMGTPWNLIWAHQQGGHVLRRLPVDAERHIDLGHVVDPARRQAMTGENLPGSDPNATLFCLAFFVKSNTQEYLLRPGIYEIDFRVYAANAHPSAIFTFHLDHKGRWFPSENQMYANGLGMRVVEKS